MKKREKMIKIGIIGFLLIVLLVVSILVITKDKNADKVKENKLYTGIINCTKDEVKNEISIINILDKIEVKEGIVQKRKFLYKIIYLDKDNYEGFKKNEKVKNPEYDDANLTIIYERDEEIDISSDNRDYEEFIQELEEQNGYICNQED